LEAVASFHATHGYGPSVRDVTAAVGYKSSGSCDYQIKQLCDLGHLTHDRRIPRSLRVVDLEVVDGE
jgi:SOS-response transcriptional repressor LexA